MPPFVGVAIKVIDVPKHTGFDPDVIAILTDGVTGGVILNDIALLVAVVEVTHVRLVVITQVIMPAVIPASV